MTATHLPERLEIRRWFKASRDSVFRAWVEPEMVEQWWGPVGYQTKVERLDPRPGGSFFFVMTGPSGASCPMSGTYFAVVRPSLLAFELKDHCIADMPNEVEPPTMPSRVNVRFEARGEQTELVLTQTGLAKDYQLLAEGGWSQSFDRMHKFSPSLSG